MRTPVIAGNWKLFKTSREAVDLVNDLMPLIKGKKGVDVVVAPVFTVLDRVRSAIAGSGISLSAQDCFWEEEGAFTGEISPKMLLDAGCSHVIIGHSERRQYFGETDATVNRKILAASAAGLVVIFCVGETLEERESGKTFEVLKKQLAGGLTGVSTDTMQQVIVAYEPVWAIGTGKTATTAQAQQAHAFIRQVVGQMFDETVARHVRIQYGGSVKPSNARELMSQPDVDGALVGGASLEVRSFADIIKSSI